MTERDELPEGWKMGVSDDGSCFAAWRALSNRSTGVRLSAIEAIAAWRIVDAEKETTSEAQR